MQSRKYLYSTILSIESLKFKYEYAAKDIIRATSREEYEQTINHYDKLISKLNQELLLLPIGFRYTGVFYIKHPYNFPTAFSKHNGVVFMREDLVSWRVEEGLDPPDPFWKRNIYKEPVEGGELKREDAEPVYAETK